MTTQSAFRAGAARARLINVCARALCNGAIILATSLPVHTTLAAEAFDDTSEQLWGNFILAIPKSERVYWEYDIEAATAVDAEEPWTSLYGTGLVEFYPNRWLDLTGELVLGAVKQTSEENSLETTLRAGFRLHLIKQFFADNPMFEKIRPERISAQRWNISYLARIEMRRFQYFGEGDTEDRPSETDTRLRSRIETKFALNKPTLSEDGLWYASVDYERFTPLGGEADISERFATKERLRIGIGYQQSYRWRYEALFIRDNARETLEEEAKVDSYILDLRIKRFF